jgi:microsomal epoxide hydrolase
MNRMHDSRLSRRSFQTAILAGSYLALATKGLAQTASQTPKPFRISIPQSTIDRIVSRVRDAQWPDKLDAPDWRYGANWNYMRDVADYWVNQFDWRKSEANLNRYPQFLARVADYDIHFYHVKGIGPKPLPLILTHGWPGSVFEFVEAIGPLTDPVRYGGRPEDSFDVIAPSLPGFAFSSKPQGKPVGPPTTARLWHRLMTEVLGYQNYAAQGGDWGCVVTTNLARLYPQSLVGIHLNAVPAGPRPAQPTPEEEAWLNAAANFRVAEFDYFNEQQHKPETVAFALNDNPLGAAAWIIEKLKTWSDSPNDLELPFTKDQMLTDIMLYLVTNTMGSAVWFYRGARDDMPPTGRVRVPTAFASFPKEGIALNPPQSLVARNYNLVHYTKMPRGGHFAFWEQPDLMVGDLREFFRTLRT